MHVNSTSNLNYYELEPEQSDFYTIGVDVTHKCNMNCSNCYSPIRTLPDLDQKKLVEFFFRLNKRTEIRFTGGEPTLREDLPYLIEKCIEAGHRASIMTNGLKLADLEYCKTLKKAGLKFVCISMNGADEDPIYKLMDQSSCADLKMKALKNLSELGFYININCIVAKGINEHIPKKLVEILKGLGTHGVLRLRNIGYLGRFQKIDNYSYEELISLVAKTFDKDVEKISSMKLVNGYAEEHNILFPIDENKKFNTTWVKVTDWRPYDGSLPDPNSKRRGRVTKDFKVAPFFEHAKLNGY